MNAIVARQLLYRARSQEGAMGAIATPYS